MSKKQKAFRRVLTIFLALILVLGCVAMIAPFVSADDGDIDFDDLIAAGRGGYCGENVIWKLNGRGVLTIGGTGAMDLNGEEAPWYQYKDEIVSVVVEDGITAIDDSAFMKLFEVTSVSLGKDVQSIGEYAFNCCTKLKTVTIPDSVKTIAEEAFGYCESLKSVVIGNGVEEIEGWAFIGCLTLENVTIGSGYAAFEPDAFEMCPSLKSVTFAAANAAYTSVNGAVYSKDKTALVYIPSGVTGKFEILSTVTQIKKGALNDCYGLDSLTIPASVKKIERQSGSEMGIVETVYYEGNASTWEKVEKIECEEFFQDRLEFFSRMSITSQPKNAAAPSGKKATTKISATGEGLKYTWYIKNKGATTWGKSSLTGTEYYVTMKSTTNGRQVYCLVTDKYGNSVKSNVVTLYMGNPAKITTQPKNASAADGNKVTTSLKATGDGLKYAWYFKNAGASTFSKSSLTGNEYYVTMKSTTTGRQVYCVVTDKYGISVTSNVVTLTSKVTITKQPANAAAAMGSKVTTKLTATGEGLKYAWYFKNKGASAFSKSSLTGNEYYVTMKDTVTGRQVYCVVTDRYGNTAKSNVVTLTSKVAITAQPANAVAANGKTVSTKLTATGEGLKYTWYYKNPSASSYTKSSSTTATYSTTMKSAANGRTVYCVITDKYGNSVKSSVATLYMGTPVKITTQPQNAVAANGQKVTTTLAASGSGLKYAWYYRNAGTTAWNKSSLTGNQYYVTAKDTTNGRQVYCQITDKYGITVKSNVVTLYMGNPAKITQQPQNAAAPNGEKIVTSLEATGDGLTYAWYFKNKGATAFSKSSLTGNEYYVTSKSTVNGRQIYCVVTDTYGTSVKSSVVTLYMGNPATITQQPEDASALNGKTASTTVKATGDGLKYTWYFKDTSATAYSKSSITTNTYTAQMNSWRTGRQVYCVVTDKYGISVKSDVATLSLKDDTPQIDWTMGSWTYTGLYCEGEYNEFTVSFAGIGRSGTVYVAYWQVLSQEEIDQYLEYGWSMDDFLEIEGEYCVNFHGTFRDFRVVNQNGNTFTLVVEYGEDGENIGTLTLELQEDKSLKIVSQENFVSDTALEVGKFFTWKEPEPQQLAMITSAPKGAFGDYGDTLNLSVTAQGENLTYQWYKLVVDEETGKGEEVLMPEVTGNTYSMVLTPENAGTWVYCKVLDDAYHYDQTSLMLLDHIVPSDSDYGFVNSKVSGDKQNLFFSVLFAGDDGSLHITIYRPLREGEEPVENGDDYKDQDVVSTEYIEVDGVRYYRPFNGSWRPVELSLENGLVKASIKEGDQEVAVIYFQRVNLNTLVVVSVSGTISDIPGYIENIATGDVYKSEL